MGCFERNSLGFNSPVGVEDNLLMFSVYICTTGILIGVAAKGMCLFFM